MYILLTYLSTITYLSVSGISLLFEALKVFINLSIFVANEYITINIIIRIISRYM